MTDAKSRRAEREDKPQSTRRAEWLGAVDAALRTLDAGELWDVWNAEADRRRLDADGNPIAERDGLYEAVVTLLIGLLGLEHGPKERALIERLRRVARGAKLAGGQERAMLLYELQEYVEALSHGIHTRKVTLLAASEMLARTLSKQHDKEVSPDDVAKALSSRTPLGRVTALEALVCEPYKHRPGSKAHSDERNERLRVVRRLLKRRSS